MDTEKLHAAVFNVVMYAAMELASFVVLNVELKRKLHISGIH